MIVIEISGKELNTLLLGELWDLEPQLRYLKTPCIYRLTGEITNAPAIEIDFFSMERLDKLTSFSDGSHCQILWVMKLIPNYRNSRPVNNIYSVPIFYVSTSLGY